MDPAEELETARTQIRAVIDDLDTRIAGSRHEIAEAKRIQSGELEGGRIYGLAQELVHKTALDISVGLRVRLVALLPPDERRARTAASRHPGITE